MKQAMSIMWKKVVIMMSKRTNLLGDFVVTSSDMFAAFLMSLNGQ